MNDDKLKIGMPAGSLANPKRGGNLIQLLEISGFNTSGYESGGPSKFITNNYLFGWDGRPQEFSSQLGINELEVAIAGDDWIQERVLELRHEYKTEINLEKVLSLNRGGVRIVGIINSDNDFTTAEEFLEDLTSKKQLITVASEMPYLALDWMMQRIRAIGKADKFSSYSVQKYKTPSKIEKGILVYETWGKTEAKIKNHGADIGMEITQTGSAIRNYGLKIVDEIMKSHTGIWINPSIKSNPVKSELLRMFLLNLYGSINAENKVLLVFNVPNEDVNKVENYLSSNNLFADEPTITIGKYFTVYNIQVDTSNTENPLAKIRFELARRNATNINTMPISSSIPGLHSIKK